MKALYILFLLSGFLFGQDWPVAHNIGHTGFSPTTHLKPPLKVKWSIKVPGLISGESGNGPVISEGKVVIQGLPNTLMCFDAETGALLWRNSIAKGSPWHYNGHFYPCIAEGKVYAVFSVIKDDKGMVLDTTDNGLRCFDLITGEVLWKKEAGFIETFRMKDSPQYSKGKILLHSLIRGKARLQAWDAQSGDSLWAVTTMDSLPYGYNGHLAGNAALCVVGDTVYASIGTTIGGKTIALNLNGTILWSTTQYFVSHYTGNIQYTGDKLLIHAGGDGGPMHAVDARTGAFVYTNPNVPSYTKIAALMNGKVWARGYGGTPGSSDLSTGAKTAVSCQLNPKDDFNSGCAAPRAANGYIYAGMGNPNPYNPLAAGHTLFAWDETGKPVWWFRTDVNVCQDVAIAYDKMYWLTNSSGEVYCFENETRTVTAIQGICLPETLEQYTDGVLKAVVSFSDGSRDTTNMSCLFKSLDSSATVTVAGGFVTSNKVGLARFRVEQYGLIDTFDIPIGPSKTLTDTPVFVRRINFGMYQDSKRYGWLPDNGEAYLSARYYGWVWGNKSDLYGSRNDRYGNWLLKSFVKSNVPTPYKIDAPDGDYIVRLAMGDNVYGCYGTTITGEWVAFGSDTICRRAAGSKNNTVVLDTLRVEGGTGMTLKVNGCINYLVMVSLNGGPDFCRLAEDSVACVTTATDKRPLPLLQTLCVSPNPFNPETHLQFMLDQSGPVSLQVYDIYGKIVRTLAKGVYPSGTHAMIWNGKNNHGKMVSSGIYMVILSGQGFKKMVRAQFLK